MLDGKLTTPIHVSLGQLDVQTQRHHLELNPELVLLALAPELLQEGLGLVELATQGEGHDKVELEDGPGGGHRVRVLLAGVVPSGISSGLCERVLLDVRWIEVVRGLGNSAKLDQGLGRVQVGQRVVPARLK